MNDAAITMTRPPRRIFTRLVLPGIIVAGAVALLLYAGWRAFAPAADVRVLQVVERTAQTNGLPAGAGDRSSGEAPRTGAPTGIAIQAPGWVEPAPYPIMVTALTPGVVRQVSALEGERVSAGQVLVQLHDEEQAIALRLAQAALAEQQARRAEMQDELQRKRRLVADGAVSQAEVARLELRVEAMEAMVAAAQAEVDMRALALERTQVRAPADGVVMARLATPGMTTGGMAEGKPLLELYDPASLQVRADVPLADAGLVVPGQRAQIQVDVLPNRVFEGVVTRLVHQADIAKNTVQAKVAITDPAPELKPDMLARVKIFPGSGQAAASGGATGADSSGAGGAAGAGLRTRLWAPIAGLARPDGAPLTDAADAADSSTAATALVVTDLRDGVGVARRRIVQLTGARHDGWAEVAEGLRSGDLLVDVAQTPVPDGTRVRVVLPGYGHPYGEGGSHVNH